MGNLVELKIRKKNQFYPKGKTYNTGDFVILTCDVVEVVKGKPRIHPVYGTITIKGKSIYLEDNEVYHFIGEEIFDEKYKSYNYNINFISDKAPTFMNTKDIEENMEDFFYNAFSKSVADKIILVPNIINILENKDINSLTKIKGIGAKKAEDIIKRYFNSKLSQVDVAKLARLGISEKGIENLKQVYGSYSVAYETVMSNPYVLADEVKYIGFAKADEIAQKIGILPNSSERMSAFVIFHLRNEARNGKAFVPQNELMGAIVANISSDEHPLDVEVLRNVIHQLRTDNILWWDDSKTIMALQEFMNTEYQLACEIKRLSSYKSTATVEKNMDWVSIVRKLEEQQGWKHTDEQFNGIRTVLDENNSFIVITGNAGTGKTTIVNAMTEILIKRCGFGIEQVALSGKASARMTEVTGYDAKTIHRLVLEYSSANADDFSFIDADILIIDEVSMVDVDTMLRLLKRVSNGTKVIMLGDPAQLPCVGRGNILQDVMDAKIIPIVYLTKIHRQAEASGIISCASQVRKLQSIVEKDFIGTRVIGELQDMEITVVEDKSEILDKVRKTFIEYLEEFQDILEVQIGVTTRIRGVNSAFNINNMIKKIYNPISDSNKFIAKCLVSDKNYYYITDGDKVIITNNNYNAEIWNEEKGNFEKGKIFNGNIGLVEKVYANCMDINLVGIGIARVYTKDYVSVELAYATTIHKYQGSQAKGYIIPLDMTGYILLSSELLYTGVTRSRLCCALIGEYSAIQRCCKNKQGNSKTTFLPRFLSDTV